MREREGERGGERRGEKERESEEKDWQRSRPRRTSASLAHEAKEVEAAPDEGTTILL